MLSGISLKNFKSIKHLDALKIKPITILCGTNSCGKSSILQSLLLLKQTKETRNPNLSLLLNGKYVHLGDIEQIIFGHHKEDCVSLKYKYEFSYKDGAQTRINRYRPPISYLFRYLLGRIKPNKDQIHQLQLDISFNISDKDKGYINTAEIINFKIIIETIDKDGSVSSGANIAIEKRENCYFIRWSKIPNTHGPSKEDLLFGEADDVVVTFENLFPIIDPKRPKEDAYPFSPIPFQVLNFLRAADDFIIHANDSVSYIGPLREEPSRRYIYENEVLEIGSKGENAAYIFKTEQDTELKSHFFYKAKGDNFEKKNSVSLKNALTRWLDFMNIKGFSADHQNEIIRLSMNANQKMKTKVNIADVGFGVSQIFPILLEGLRMQKGGTMLLEQPEIHLHPCLQMQMADYFISLALSNKKVVVETHSDHIVNRLVRRIVEDKKYGLKDLVSIYFVSNNGESRFEEVEIDENRGIKNWPEGFFDQTALEQERIIMAGLEKRKNK